MDGQGLTSGALKGDAGVVARSAAPGMPTALGRAPLPCLPSSVRPSAHHPCQPHRRRSPDLAQRQPGAPSRSSRCPRSSKSLAEAAAWGVACCRLAASWLCCRGAWLAAESSFLHARMHCFLAAVHMRCWARRLASASASAAPGASSLGSRVPQNAWQVQGGRAGDSAASCRRTRRGRSGAGCPCCCAALAPCSAQRVKPCMETQSRATPQQSPGSA